MLQEQIHENVFLTQIMSNLSILQNLLMLFKSTFACKFKLLVMLENYELLRDWPHSVEPDMNYGAKYSPKFHHCSVYWLLLAQLEITRFAIILILRCVTCYICYFLKLFQSKSNCSRTQ